MAEAEAGLNTKLAEEIETGLAEARERLQGALAAWETRVWPEVARAVLSGEWEKWGMRAGLKELAQLDQSLRLCEKNAEKDLNTATALMEKLATKETEENGEFIRLNAQLNAANQSLQSLHQNNHRKEVETQNLYFSVKKEVLESLKKRDELSGIDMKLLETGMDAEDSDGLIIPDIIKFFTEMRNKATETAVEAAISLEKEASEHGDAHKATADSARLLRSQLGLAERRLSQLSLYGKGAKKTQGKTAPNVLPFHLYYNLNMAFPSEPIPAQFPQEPEEVELPFLKNSIAALPI